MEAVHIALAAVVLGFVISLVDPKYRKLSLIIGSVLAIVSIIFLMLGVIGLIEAPLYEAGQLSTLL